jgi:hypothetical protein
MVTLLLMMIQAAKLEFLLLALLRMRYGLSAALRKRD